MSKDEIEREAEAAWRAKWPARDPKESELSARHFAGWVAGFRAARAQQSAKPESVRCVICGSAGNHSPGCSGAKPESGEALRPRDEIDWQDTPEDDDPAGEHGI